MLTGNVVLTLPQQDDAVRPEAVSLSGGGGMVGVNIDQGDGLLDVADVVGCA